MNFIQTARNTNANMKFLFLIMLFISSHEPFLVVYHPPTSSCPGLNKIAVLLAPNLLNERLRARSWNVRFWLPPQGNFPQVKVGELHLLKLA